jgi:Na+/proline symporter
MGGGSSMDPLTLNAFVTLFLLVAFFLLGAYQYRSNNDYESFFLRRRNVQGNEYSSSFAASSTSLATVLIFFITYGASEGLGILIAPLSYVLGSYILARLIPYIGQHNIIHSGTTLGNLLWRIYGNSLVGYAICIIAIVGLLCILLIELYVGVEIFRIYTNVSAQSLPVALVLISVAVFSYVSLGGFSGVIRTDRIQMMMIWGAILFSLMYYLTNTEVPYGQGSDWLPNPLLDDGRFILPIPLLLNILAVNVFLLPAQLRTWQMAAASSSPLDMRNGLLRGAVSVAVLWTLFAILGVLLQARMPNTEIGLISVLKAWSQSGETIESYVLFPLVFAACLAALLSSADSAILPIIQSIETDFLEGHFQFALWRSRFLILLLLILTIGVYYIVFVVYNYGFFRLLFTLFSVLIALAPAILAALLKPNKAGTEEGDLCSGIGLVRLCDGSMYDLALFNIARRQGYRWLAR